MISEELPKTGKIFAYAGVRQDKQPQTRLTADSFQPATADYPAVGSKGGSATATETAHEYKADTPPAVDRKTQHGSEKRQTEQVTGRVPHHIKTKLLEKAERNGWKESRAVAEACTVYVENDLAEQFGVKLAARVTEAIEKGLQKISNRLAYIGLHGYYATEENRIISTKVYQYLFGADTEIYKQTVEQSQKDAYTNIRRPIKEKKQTPL
jgi:hypothetical protein